MVVVIMIVIVVMIVPVVMGAPAMSIFVPPAVIVIPAIVAGRSQLGAPFFGLRAVPAMFFGGFMKFMIGVLGALLAVVVRAKCR